MLGATIVFSILCVVSPEIGFPDWMEKTFPEHRITWYLGIVAAAFFVAWCFVWLPFRRHELLKLQMPNLAIRATAKASETSSVFVEVVNSGRSKICIKELEATFSDGSKATKPPLFDYIQGNYVQMGFELKEYGDMATVRCVESMFARLPVELTLIDTFDNHYPVTNCKEALLSIAHTRPPATRQ